MGRSCSNLKYLCIIYHDFLSFYLRTACFKMPVTIHAITKGGIERLIKTISRSQRNIKYIDAKRHNHVRLLGRTTGDGEDLAVDPAAIARGKESYHAGNILGDGATTERAVLGHEGFDLVGGPLGGATRNVVPVHDFVSGNVRK